MTNLNKTREEIVYELLISLNHGNSSYVQDRVRLAIDQYDELVQRGIVKKLESPYVKHLERQKNCDHDWFPMKTVQMGMTCTTEFKCMKCGITEVRDTSDEYQKYI